MECGQPENIKDGHLLCWKEALEAKVLGKGKPYGREEFDKVLGRYSVSPNDPFPGQDLLLRGRQLNVF